MLRGLDLGDGDAVVLASVHQAQEVSGGEEPDGAFTDDGLGDHALFVSLHHEPIGAAAVEVAPRVQRQGDAFLRAGGDLVVLVEVPDGPAVGDVVALEAPSAPEGLPHEHVAGAAGFAVGAVVGAHDCFHAGIDKCFECREICLIQVLFGGDGVEDVPEILGTAVDGEVLCACGGFHDRSVALKALHECGAHPCGEVRVLSQCLVASAPSGIAEDVDVRGPERQPLVDVPVALCGCGIVLRPSLRRADLRLVVDEVRVERRGHGYRLREHRGRAGPGHPVERLVPPVVGGNPKPLDRRCIEDELPCGLFNRHPRNKLAGLVFSFDPVHMNPCTTSVGHLFPLGNKHRTSLS